MSTNKLILKTKKFTPGESNIIRMTDEAMARIAELQAASGLPASHIASSIIEFFADSVEIERS